jgi:hypothetical protein
MNIRFFGLFMWSPMHPKDQVLFKAPVDGMTIHWPAQLVEFCFLTLQHAKLYFACPCLPGLIFPDFTSLITIAYHSNIRHLHLRLFSRQLAWLLCSSGSWVKN